MKTLKNSFSIFFVFILSTSVQPVLAATIVLCQSSRQEIVQIEQMGEMYQIVTTSAGSTSRTQPQKCKISGRMKQLISAGCSDATGAGLSYVFKPKDSLFDLFQRFELPGEAPVDQLIISNLNCRANN